MDKKTSFLIFLGILALAICPFGSVLAQLEWTAPNAPAVGNIQDIVHSVESVVGLVFGGIAVVMFVAAGVLFLTAQGDPQKVSTARMAFIWGVAGVIVGLVAFSIIAIVFDFMT